MIGITWSSSARKRKRKPGLEIMSSLALILILAPFCVHSKYYDDTSTSDEAFVVRPRVTLPSGNWTEVGVSPPVLNLATNAHIDVNATCGEKSAETYCKLVEHAYSSRRNNVRTSQCQVCDAHSSDKGKRHPIRYTIDGSNRWWQSPTLQNGRHFEWVTITIDLKQIYQVAYIIIKSGISPRPGNWILERSLDGYEYRPWQYYAMTDDECLNRYKIRAKPGKPSYNHDEEVICTSYYSQIQPFEGGEIHTSLVNGRPGADGPSETLTRFTMARYVKLRLQKIRTLHADLMTGGVDTSVLRRYFYSIKDISIGGHCVCFGHANECVMDRASGTEKCMCQHNTCGDRCDICCPLYNQYPWGAGNSTDSMTCQKCQCYGHSDSCVYDKQIDEEKRSKNIHGNYDGGGVCLNCKHNTTGVNCDICVEGYYRPKGVALDDPEVCRPCQCHGEGSTGKCVRDEEESMQKFGGELLPGECVCREGFQGEKCDKCAMGFKNFPRCAPCECNIAGITNMDCEGDCQCKINVEGRLCSKCVEGYYNLKKENTEGCTQCFCHEVSDTCVSSNFSVVQQMNTGDNWFVTDLHGTKIVAAVEIIANDDDDADKQKSYQIANEEFAHFSEYFWTMGNSTGIFIGNRIHSYGLNITFRVSWVQARGDTSGRPIPNYDLIVQGRSMMLGFGYSAHDGNNATISVVLNHANCQVLPDVDNHISKITGRVGSSTERPVPCTRLDVMQVLSDVRKVLYRAKFHTDQIEGFMHWAYYEGALVTPGNITGVLVPGVKATSIEVCSCPKGYAGTSCEECSYGYRKASKDTWLTECIQCDCNGHAESCSWDGKCFKCDHHTRGDQCEFCEEGYYGDPTVSGQSCRKCECPSHLPSNNFSPSCTSTGSGYKCTACPEGYEGDHCERCGNGYYGNPNHPGDYCKPCMCTNIGDRNVSDICDHLTGECLVCPRNTVGWNCDECAPGHYGNPLNGTCLPCGCSEVGSSSVTSCHHESGQCSCKPNFGGRSCDKCLEGHGNPKEGCPTCGCNLLGSLDQICDIQTGQCPCKFGVTGRYCNKCEENHFGLQRGNGCSPCECNPQGCDRQDLCDLQSGQCHCLPHVFGRQCDSCEPGWWNIQSGTGCQRCSCDEHGSFDRNCDAYTGQCVCKPGVGGPQCNQCLPGHWGKSREGCKICDPCDKPGHICDPHTGRCVCPPNTEGDQCEKCQVGFWGYSPMHGCTPCNCTSPGAAQPQCHPTTGKCQCLWGFEGDKCTQCRHGYFGYPSCSPCQCDKAGTLDAHCNGENGTCSCHVTTGQCACKENVMGASCDRCKPGYYGLDENNTEGCMQCFCFLRTNKCSQGFFKWQRFAMPVSHDRNSLGPHIRTDSQLRRINDLMVIPDTARDVIIEKDISFSMPLYWQLPHIFLGDKVLSYNGYLRFNTHSIAGIPQFPNHVLNTYPVIQIQGNHRLILEHYPVIPYTKGYYEVHLHEDTWTLKNGPYNGQVSKEVMMVALQNLQHIFIRATHAPEVYNASLFNVSLDIAMPSPTQDKTLAHGVEVCDCPPEYNSTSCQNPRIGWYRWYKRDYITSTVIIDLVGEAKRCDCNGRALSCDTESGRCQNCLENTGGARCDLCAEGHYGNPLRGRCLPCPCPSVWNNHAKTCHQRTTYPQWPPPPQGVVPGGIKWHCQCRQGYTGPSCDRCDYGFYGRPWERGGACVPCRCNPYGSVSDECDEITGQCNCRPGVTGRDCSKCKDRHVIIGKECTSCNDQCTGTLLDDVAQIERKLSGVKVDPEQVLVWKTLANLDVVSANATVNWNNQRAVSRFLEDLPSLEGLSGVMTYRMEGIRKQCEEGLSHSYDLAERGKVVKEMVVMTDGDMRRNVRILKDYVEGRLDQRDSSEVKNQIEDLIEALETVSSELEQATKTSEDELEEVNKLYDELLVKIFNSSGNAGNFLEWMRESREKVEELNNYIQNCTGKVEEAKRIMVLAREHLENVRISEQAVDGLIMELDKEAVITQTQLNEASYLRTELEQGLYMIEHILRDFRNTTKDLEIKDNVLYDQVPLYRVLYAQPAFDWELELIMQQKYIEGRFGQLVGHGNGSQLSGIQAVTAYERMRIGFEEALRLARNATEIGRRTASEIQAILEDFSLAGVLEESSSLVDSSLVLTAQLENGSIRRNLTECKSTVDRLDWSLKQGNETLRQINSKLDQYLENDMKLPELSTRIDEITDAIREVNMAAMETESRVNVELKARIDAIRGGAPFDAVDAAIQVNRVSHQIPQVEHDILQGQRRLELMSSRNKESLQDRLKNLKALIQQSRHKANTVGVSIGPDDTGTCFRVYNLPQLMDESATYVKFNFAPTRTDDSLLIYWPSSLNGDFVSIEMVNLHVKVSWDLGSGVRSLTHPTKLHPQSLGSDDPDHWWVITFDRIGSSVTLNVKQVMVDPTAPVQPDPVPVKYINSDDEATLLNLSPGDYLHVGGMSSEMRQGLTDNGIMAGCIHQLHLNQKPVGLWNFARTEGCQACVECPDVLMDTDSSRGDLDYYFDGRGYAVVERIISQTFNPKVFDVSFEFKTFAENGLLFLTVNKTVGQIISVELKDGRMLMNVRHRWGAQEEKDILRVETEPPELKFNTGEWTEVRVLWMFFKGTQTAQLIVGNQDFTQEKRSSGGYPLMLNLHQANYQIGGVSPQFDPSKWDHVLPQIVPYVGCIKNVLVDGSTYDPMRGHYHGVESPCGGKSVYLTSFDGNGFAEFSSAPIGKNFKLGFSFKTVQPTGLMVLSTFAKGLESPDEHYYAFYLEKGKVKVQLGVPQGPFDLSSNGTRYDDGRFHSVRFVKKAKKLFLYVDDDEVDVHRMSKQASVNAPSSRGLFIGGTNLQIKQKFDETPLPVRSGFSGCIQNFQFGNDLLNFNYPVSYKNHNLGQCGKHHEPDPLLVKYLHPNLGVDSSAVIRVHDPDCARPKRESQGVAEIIEQEEPFKAWNFGDNPNSYATLSLLGSKVLKQSFNISFHFRTFYPNGMFFQGLKKRGNGGYCLMSFLKDGQVIVKLHGNRPQDLVSSVSSLNDGQWHHIEIIKAEDKLFLHIDAKNATQTQVPHKMKAIGRLHIGGVPSDGHDCLENAIHKPENFKGCLKNFIINSHSYNLDSNSALLSNVSPCFKRVEKGSFFRSGSFAVYSYNFTLGTLLEVDLDFRSDSRHGLLLSLIPNKVASRYPQFSIFLRDGKVIARETISGDEYYEASADFSPNGGYICDGNWHNIKANYEKGSITLRVDGKPPIFALSEPDSRGSLSVGGSSRDSSGERGQNINGFPSNLATIYIGGEDGNAASRSNSKLQFHGCIRNIVLNRQIRDWTDMALIQNVYLNSCPI